MCCIYLKVEPGWWHGPQSGACSSYLPLFELFARQRLLNPPIIQCLVNLLKKFYSIIRFSNCHWRQQDRHHRRYIIIYYLERNNHSSRTKRCHRVHSWIESTPSPRGRWRKNRKKVKDPPDIELGETWSSPLFRC